MVGKTSDALAERERIKKDLLALDKEIESAFKLHSEMNSSPSVLDLVREKLESLADKKRELVKYLESTEDLIQKDQDAREARKVIEDQALAFKKGWKKANPNTQKRLLRRLIDQVIYTPEGLFTYYVTTREMESVGLNSQELGASEQDSGASPIRSYYLGSRSNRPSVSYLSDGASVVRASGGGGNRTPCHANEKINKINATWIFHSETGSFPLIVCRHLSASFVKILTLFSRSNLFGVEKGLRTMKEAEDQAAFTSTLSLKPAWSTIMKRLRDKNASSFMRG